jgi:Asp-tRNA(Asn)/Glu-tRNA(Gln) amidotransferase A subunit family amidase
MHGLRHAVKDLVPTRGIRTTTAARSNHDFWHPNTGPTTLNVDRIWQVGGVSGSGRNPPQWLARSFRITA